MSLASLRGQITSIFHTIPVSIIKSICNQLSQTTTKTAGTIARGLGYCQKLISTNLGENQPAKQLTKAKMARRPSFTAVSIVNAAEDISRRKQVDCSAIGKLTTHLSAPYFVFASDLFPALQFSFSKSASLTVIQAGLTSIHTTPSLKKSKFGYLHLKLHQQRISASSETHSTKRHTFVHPFHLPFTTFPTHMSDTWKNNTTKLRQYSIHGTRAYSSRI